MKEVLGKPRTSVYDRVDRGSRLSHGLTMNDQRNKVLLLTSDAGFGHRNASRAVEDALRQLDGSLDLKTGNLLQDPELPDLIRQIETGYDSMVTDDPTLYQLAYAATDAPVVAKLMQDVATT